MSLQATPQRVEIVGMVSVNIKPNSDRATRLANVAFFKRYFVAGTKVAVSVLLNTSNAYMSMHTFEQHEIANDITAYQMALDYVRALLHYDTDGSVARIEIAKLKA